MSQAPKPPKTDKQMKQAPDPLDQFIAACQEGPEAIMLMLWLQRFENPGFTVEVHPKDIKAFYDCVNYLEVKPQIQVLRPGGAPAVEAVPAHGNRRAIPGRAAIPPKNYAVIQMVDENGNTFVPIESDEDAAKRRDLENAIRRAKDNAITIANALRNDITSGQFSTGNLQDAITALTTLATQ